MMLQVIPSEPAETGSGRELVDAFLRRTQRALGRIAEQMPRERLVDAVGAATDTEVLFRSLQDMAAIGAEVAPAPDPLTAALLRGAAMKRSLLQAEGGALSGPDLAIHLGVTPQAIGKRREKGQLFWLEIGEGYVYPAFQLAGSGLLPGIREVLRMLGGVDPWTQVQFMLTPERRLAGRRPLDVLRVGDIEPVLVAARALGEHGA